MSYTARVRRARKIRFGCHVIMPGELYIEHTEFPGGDDTGYADSARHQVRMAECRTCAQRYGRGDMFNNRDQADA
jgi:hypothetical protein